jgi:hypothetical protein
LLGSLSTHKERSRVYDLLLEIVVCRYARSMSSGIFGGSSSGMVMTVLHVLELIERISKDQIRLRGRKP